jgi:hypothetical protein
VDLFGGGLENSTIFVKGQSSRERPTDLNYTLAQKRAEEGLRLVREVLGDYFAGKNVRIEILVESDASVYDGMTEEQIEEIVSWYKAYEYDGISGGLRIFIYSDLRE